MKRKNPAVQHTSAGSALTSVEHLSIGWTSSGSASRASRSSIGFDAPAKNPHAGCAIESVALVVQLGPIFSRNHRPSSADPVEWMEQLSQELWVEPIFVVGRSDFRRIAALFFLASHFSRLRRDFFSSLSFKNPGFRVWPLL